MIIGNWMIEALLALLFWSLMVFLPKLAIATIPPSSAIIYEVLGGVTVALVLLALLGFRPVFEFKGALLAYAAGLCGFLGTLAYFYAVSKGPVSVVSTITALYPVITVTLGVAMLHEPMSGRQIVGCLMALGSIVILTL